MGFTEQELAALKEMIEQWMHEGFTTQPYEPEVQSIIRKLGMGDRLR